MQLGKAMNMMRTLAVLGIALAHAVPSASSAQDESYPTHTVRLIAPSGAGGNPDVLARLLAEGRDGLQRAMRCQARSAATDA